jgi:Ser/Thr protein kinase RdoA (MazF antagonist)
MTLPEMPLRGGRVTPGVVRVGETVRRPVSGDRTLQREFLEHLYRRGFSGAPRFLGIDEVGREILSYLPGVVPKELGHFSDEQISAAGKLMHRFHAASVDFPLVALLGMEVMCHNDWSPTNTVFLDGLPCGIIDFDTIAPGKRLWDVGYSAWLWLDIGDDACTADEQRRRLRLFANSYSLELASEGELVKNVLARQSALGDLAVREGKGALADWCWLSRKWTEENLPSS